MKKGFVFAVHSVAGLLSGLFILLMSLSGAALVFHEELDNLQYPAITAGSNDRVLSVDSCYHILQHYYPHAQVSNCSIAENNTQPFIFSVYDSSYKSGTENMQVFIHPQTGEVLKTRGGSKDPANNFMSWVSAFHNSFHLQKKGEWLLGFFGVVFLISMVTGIIMYRKKMAAVLSFSKAVFQKNNLHQIIGVYALVFNLMIAITGVWMQRYVFKKEFYAAQNTHTAVLKSSPPLFFRLDSALIKTKNEYPDFTGYIIYFAQNKRQKTTVYGSRKTNSFIHSKKFADVIFMDSVGNITSTAFVNEIDPGSRYDIINSQIHFGKYGGLPVKIIYSLFGLTGGVLSITGFLLWIKRKKYPDIS